MGAIQPTTRTVHVKWYHRVFAGFEPIVTAGHATALAGMRKISPTPQPGAPVSPAMLDWIANHIDHQKPQHRLMFGAALLGFFYLLRSGEYLGVKGGRHRYALEVRDVEVFDAMNRPAVRFCDATSAAEELSKVLKEAAAANGYDPQQFSCHSLRSGGASALIGEGADSTTIKLHGRWKSNSFQRYTHYSDDVGAPLAAIMAGTSNCTYRATP
ncbi:hypothetical protein F441_10378 [Phytophthora nicotianae CJ01A1]|uniref:Tyr recombinase domain-containing protein n=2 Tax=Phytophthora nicotianae TaxID=4792 RepID=W2WYP5_PHYNI|nr:hypothetical protein L915_10200 [Phytophthora nicotianae]ETP14699.1 hypothetical protein F441_10378 [Phytophthora nicotianae CJ01A1]